MNNNTTDTEKISVLKKMYFLMKISKKKDQFTKQTYNIIRDIGLALDGSLPLTSIEFYHNKYDQLRKNNKRPRFSNYKND